MIPRHLQALYCDDIRQEVGNKMSFMGVYDAYLFATQIPCEIPKLCVRVVAVTPESRRFEKLIVRILFDDKMLLETGDIAQQIGRNDPNEGLLFDLTAPDERQSLVASYTVIATLAPFRIAKPGLLRVQAETEDGDLIGSALRVSLPPAARTT